jgi:hypothetical protein
VELVPPRNAADLSRVQDLESGRMEPSLTRTGSAAKRRETRARVRTLVQRNLDTSHVYDLRCRVILHFFMSKRAGAERLEVLLRKKSLVQSVLARFHV